MIKEYFHIAHLISRHLSGDVYKRQARDYFLLIGPPGTGKTSRALRGMVEAFYREGKQILLDVYKRQVM